MVVNSEPFTPAPEPERISRKIPMSEYYDVNPAPKEKVSKPFLVTSLTVSLVLCAGLGALSVFRGNQLNTHVMIQDCVLNTVHDYRHCYFEVTGKIWPAPAIAEPLNPDSEPPGFPEHINIFDNLSVI